MIQDREYAKECLILCDFLWPILDLENTEDHVGDPTLESKILSAVTGNEVDEEGLYKMGERVFNLHRAIFVRESHRGRESITIPDSWHTVPLAWDYYNPECLMPGKDGEVICRRGAVVERQEFEKLKEEYHQLRGWDPGTGLQTREILEELGLQEVAERNMANSRYLAERICEISGFEPLGSAPFFNEFPIRVSVAPEEINRKLLEQGIIGGLALGRYFSELDDCLLFCTTETKSVEDLDQLAEVLEGAARG